MQDLDREAKEARRPQGANHSLTYALLAVAYDLREVAAAIRESEL